MGDQETETSRRFRTSRLEEKIRMRPYGPVRSKCEERGNPELRCTGDIGAALLTWVQWAGPAYSGEPAPISKTVLWSAGRGFIGNAISTASGPNGDFQRTPNPNAACSFEMSSESFRRNDCPASANSTPRMPSPERIGKVISL